jgi:hypothetical protein
MLRRIPVLCLLVIVPVSFGQVVPMTNDECNNAIAVTAGANPSPPNGVSGNVYTNVGSTQSPSFICISGVSFDVWFKYTATATGSITVTTCTPPGLANGSLNDTVLSVFDGAACPPTLMLGCDDDTCGFRSSVSNVPVTSGGLYYIRVSGLFGSTGTFYVNVTPPSPPTLNDDCATAIPLSLGSNGPFSNSSATSSVGVAASCGIFASPGYRDLWYTFTPSCSGIVNVNAGCNSFDMILTAYASCGGAEIACNDDAQGCGGSPAISFPGTAGVTYRVRAASWSAANPATFFINVTLGSGLALAFTSPLGPGSVQVNLTDGPPSGLYFLPVTFFAGAFPTGWLFGVDIPLTELLSLLNAGSPFVGAFNSCGQVTIGPIGGLGFLSGVPLYAVVLGLPAGSPVPTVHSAPVTYTIP